VPAAAAETALRALLKAAAVTRAFLARLGFVDGQRPTLEASAIEVGDGLIAAFRHLDEPEAARTAGFPIRHNLRGRDRTVLAKHFAEVVRRGLEGEVSDIQILTHRNPLRA